MNTRAMQLAREALTVNFREEWALNDQTVADLIPHVAKVMEQYRQEAPADALLAAEAEVVLFRAAWSKAQAEVGTRPWPEDAKARISELDDELGLALARVQRLEEALEDIRDRRLMDIPGIRTGTSFHEWAHERATTALEKKP